MEMPFYRDTWVEIDLDAVEQNVVNMKRRLPDNTVLMAVVKANGYGHGAFEVAKTALQAGAEWLAVALLDEAVALREKGIEAPILVLGPIRAKDVAVAAKYHISLTVFQPEWVEQASQGYQSEEPVFFHIKCDTGMGRIGIRRSEEAKTLADQIKKDKRFVIEGAFTHFSTADENDEAYFEEQYHRFETMIGWLADDGVHPNMIHCGNSAATLKYAATGRNLFNMVRYGVAMYGMSPSPEMKEHLPFELKPAFTLHSRLTHVKKVEPGAAISYGATYHASDAEWIGTVPIGYADGWIRALGGTDVLIGGERCPIVGRICMDQLMCRLPQKMAVGTGVTLIGKNGQNEITADDLAGKLKTINYEITCMISPRVPRIYFRNGIKVKVDNAVLLHLEK